MSDPLPEPQNNVKLVWPRFAIAFMVLGALLWVSWMVKFIHQTRASKGEDFFVPMTTNPLPIHAAPPGLVPIPPSPAATNK